MSSNSLLFQSLAVALGGAVGSLGRFWLSQWNATQSLWPAFWMTCLINIAGSFALGWVTQSFARESHPLLFVGLGVGLLGGFTTMSTFSLEALTLIREGKSALAGVLVLVTLLGCIGGAALALRTQPS